MATPLKRIRIDVRKLNKAHYFEGKPNAQGHRPLYADMTLWDNGTISQYGDDGFITQDVNKEARERGEKGAILGNSKPIKAKGAETAPARQTAPTMPAEPGADENLPF